MVGVDQVITTAIAEYDKGVMENFSVVTEAINKVLADYDVGMKKQIGDIAEELENSKKIALE